MGSPADRVNRVMLTLLGLLLLIAGATGLLFGLGAFGATLAGEQVLADEVKQFVVEQAAWFWPVVAVLSLLLAVLALRWLVLQLQTDRVGDLDLTERRNDGETHVDSTAVTDALVAATEATPGVQSASARLVRAHGDDQLVLFVRLADRVDLAAVRSALADGPLTDLRQALGADTCPQVRVELEPSTRGRARSLA